MKELVSIIVPIYNGEQYVTDCANFIKKQTYSNWEAIFVNDGSKDNTAEVCSSIVEEDSRFSLVNKKNGGTSTTRNAGLEVAKGNYVAFLDVDDEYDPRMIEVLVDILEKNDVDMSICGYYFKVDNGNGDVFIEEKNFRDAAYHSKEELYQNYVELWDSDMFYNIWNKLYRKSIIDKYNIRYREGHVYTEDRVFNRAFLERSQKVAITNKCLYYYVRERIGSTSEKYRDDYFDIRIKEYHELISHFKKIDLWNEESIEYISREFIERTAGAIENIFHADNKLKNSDKYNKIRSIVLNQDVKNAANYAKCKSKKMQIFVWPIKHRLVPAVYLMGKMIYSIRKINPIWFHKIKSKR